MKSRQGAAKPGNGTAGVIDFRRPRIGRHASASVLYIGAENWPFPIPLVSRNVVWRFDSNAGMHEIQYRRIGENEVTALALCQALVAQSHPVDADACCRAP
jgi:hypothetical protein